MRTLSETEKRLRARKEDLEYRVETNDDELDYLDELLGRPGLIPHDLTPVDLRYRRADLLVEQDKNRRELSIIAQRLYGSTIHPSEQA